MACPEGIEPPTHSLEGCCSIQLSYGQTAKLSPWHGAARTGANEKAFASAKAFVKWSER
jgi:hypothetical protein